MTFKEYLASLRGKSVAVIGCGVSNRPLLRALGGSDAVVCAYDRKTKEALGEFADELDALGIGFVGGEDYLSKLSGDVIFRTPGLRPDVPEILRCVDSASAPARSMP